MVTFHLSDLNDNFVLPQKTAEHKFIGSDGITYHHFLIIHRFYDFAKNYTFTTVRNSSLRFANFSCGGKRWKSNYLAWNIYLSVPMLI